MSFPHTETAPIVSTFLDTTSRHIAKHSMSEVSYLDMVEKPASTPDTFAEISLQPLKQVIEMETFRLNAKCNSDIAQSGVSKMVMLWGSIPHFKRNLLQYYKTGDAVHR